LSLAFDRCQGQAASSIFGGEKELRWGAKRLAFSMLAIAASGEDALGVIVVSATGPSNVVDAEREGEIEDPVKLSVVCRYI
jgi:hypothetical protein